MADPSVVQHKGTDSGSTTTSITLAFASNNVARNTIVVAFRIAAAAPTGVTVSDTQGNTYNQIFLTSDGANETTGLYYAQNIKAGANTPQVSITSTAVIMTIAIIELGGVAVSNVLDKSANTTGNSTAPASGNTASTTQANEICIAVVGTNATKTINAAGGYNLLDQVPTGVSAGRLGTAYLNVTTKGAQNGQFSYTVATAWVCGVATFRGMVPMLPPNLTTGAGGPYFPNPVT